MLSALILGGLGFVMLRTAFAPEPDPRIVLAAMFGSQKSEIVGQVRRSRNIGPRVTEAPTPESGFEYDGLNGYMPFTRILDERRQAR